jgi:hypothetical protein
MGLFIRSPKTRIDELCQNFYENHIFGNADFCDDAFQFIAQNDAAKSIDKNLFLGELWALRIELFGLALWNYIHELASKDEYEKRQMLLIEEVCNEIKFTKGYLGNLKMLTPKVKLDIWEVMAFYNKAIAEAINNKPFLSLSGLAPFIKISGGEEGERKVRLHIQQALIDINSKAFKKFIVDSECLARLLNRAGSRDEEWHEGYISQALSRRFAERLGYVNKLNWEGIFRFEALILGLYNGARNFIETLPFSPEYQNELNKLLKAIKRVTRNKEKE